MSPRRSIDFAGESVDVATQLVGSTLLVDGVGGVIVETEAYDQIEPASHSFRGPTRGSAVLFGPPGHAYVYLSYGIHWCLNIVCRETGHGARVLIRALEPTTRVGEMIRRRKRRDAATLCAGPGRLGQALGITAALSGMPLDSRPFQIMVPDVRPQVVQGTRIGISKGVEHRWRFGLSDSAFHSRPFR